VIKSPKEVKSIYVPPSSLPTKVFYCDLPKNELKGTRALQYILWGESLVSKGRQKQASGTPIPKLPTLRGRDPWYSIRLKQPGDFFCNRFFNDRFFFAYSNGILEDQTFYAGTFKNKKQDKEVAIATLNSTIVSLTASLLGRVALGEGVLQYAVYEMSNLIVVNPLLLPDIVQQKLLQLFSKLKNRRLESIFQETTLTDRFEFDEVLLEYLGLGSKELNQLYKSVCTITNSRLSKAETY